MISRRPYLIRAMYEWMVDTDQVPHLLVDATLPDVEVPDAYVDDGRIILNVSPTATQELLLGNEEIAFRARFGGQPRLVRFPVQAVLAVYARESGEGMMFGGELPEEQDARETPESADTPQESRAESEKGGERPRKGRPDLKVIK